MNKVIKIVVAGCMLALLTTVTSCSGGSNGANGGNSDNSKTSVADSLASVNTNLKGDLTEKEAALQDFVNGFNDIQANLDEIKAKEKIVTNAAKDGDVKSKEEQIKTDIQAIYDLMAKNRQRIAALSNKLKTANTKIDGLEKMIAGLEAQLTEKDAQIGDLKNQLEQKNIELTNLNTNYQNLEQDNQGKVQQLNTAYYIIGTGKELKAYGVTAKEGGFIGLGKKMEVKPDFNKDKFTKIDITQVTSIPLGAKKVNVLTIHPSSSYKLVGEKPVQKIDITNPTDFWSSSKYLVIVLE
ncbi:MAG: Cbp1 family collagen-binding glycoprotein adhesin [Bacteroidia bacterium]